ATTSDVIASVLTAQPQSLSKYGIPQKLEEVVAKVLRKEAKDRYQTSAELLDDLNNLKKELESQQKLYVGSGGMGPAKTEKPKSIITDKKLWTRTALQEPPRWIKKRISGLNQTVTWHRQLTAIASTAIIILIVVIAVGVYKLFINRNRTAVNFKNK